MSDIVERLRDWDHLTIADAVWAAEAIELLREQHALALTVHNKMADEIERLRKALTAASHALRSYQYGNGATDLAQDVADKCDAALTSTPPPTSSASAA